MTKISPFFLSLLLVSSLSPSMTSANYLDVELQSTYSAPVEWLENIGAIHSGSHFYPDEPLSRAAFLKMAFLAAGIQYLPFPENDLAADVPQKIWYSPYYARALQWHAIEADADGLLRPEKTITRAEAYRVGMTLWGIGIPLNLPDDLGLPDVRRDIWFAPYLYRASTLELIERKPGEAVQPFRKLTRAEGAELLYKLNNQIEESPRRQEEEADVPTITINVDPQDERTNLLLEIWRQINSQYLYTNTIDESELRYGAIAGLVDALNDPHTEFFSPDKNEEFSANLENEVVGIGAHVNMENGRLVIVTPVPGGPANRAGMRPHDIIVNVDDIDINSMPKMDAIRLIRGEEGSTVRITVYRPDSGETLVFSLVRELIDEPSVELEITPQGYTIIHINQFTGDTSAEFANIAEEIKSRSGQNRGIIIDLRNNPGGYLDTALHIANYFMADGEVITATRDRYGNQQNYQAEGNGDFLGQPLVILINNGSASASEIVAGALSGNNRALLIGQTTYGKGTAQSVQRYSDGSILKMTIAEWLLPNGSSINSTGIKPDLEIIDEPDTMEDEQMQRALLEIASRH